MPRQQPVFTDVYNFRIHRSESASTTARPHRHHEVEVNFVECGEITYLLGGRMIPVQAGRFCFFWAAIPHHLVAASPDAAGLWWVTVPLPWLMSWEFPKRLLRRLLDGELLSDPSPRDTDAGRFREWRDLIGNADRLRERPAILEVEARFRRFSLENSAATAVKPQTLPTTIALQRVEKMARFLVEHYHEPLTLADIAEAVGVHPNYAANLFRRHFDQTLFQCLTHHRIANAQRLLATTDAKVIDVAGESGFGSLSRFYDAFSRACKMTPAEYRAQFAFPAS